MSRLVTNPVDVQVPELRAESRLRELEQRIADLEAQKVGQKITLNLTNAAPPYDLGPWDGDAISGVKLHIHGTMTHTATGVWLLQANGLTSMGTDWVAQRFYVSGGAAGTDVQFGLFNAANVGLYLGHFAWSAGGPTYWDATGVFHTRRPTVGARVWQGQYGNADGTNSNNMIGADVISKWWDNVAISSLRLTTTGTAVQFSGKITAEAF
jgi:hypothetical protein